MQVSKFDYSKYPYRESAKYSNNCESPWLLMKSEDVTAEFLGTDVLK